VQNTLDSLGADPNSAVDGKKQGIALSSSLLNAANCSASPDCLVLFRFDCAFKANTCGVCLDGYYSAMIGADNSACLSILGNGDGDGDGDGDGNGDGDGDGNGNGDGVVKQCAGDCSGRGLCEYIYTDSGFPMDGDVELCVAGDPSCSAVCECEDGFDMSADCSLSDADMQTRRAQRLQLLTYLSDVTVTERADKESVRYVHSYLFWSYVCLDVFK
jgi:hypothetical protein